MPYKVHSQFEERSYQPEDLGALVQIEKEAGDAGWSRIELEFFAEHLFVDTRVVTPIEAPDTPIGFYVVEHGEETLYLCNIAVAADWRRRGVASFALEAATELARSINYEELALDVQELNLGAQLLYRKAGFRAIGIRRGYYTGQDGYHMVKRLQSAVPLVAGDLQINRF